jgi:hypothetical protein
LVDGIYSSTRCTGSPVKSIQCPKNGCHTQLCSNPTDTIIQISLCLNGISDLAIFAYGSTCMLLTGLQYNGVTPVTYLMALAV